MTGWFLGDKKREREREICKQTAFVHVKRTDANAACRSFALVLVRRLTTDDPCLLITHNICTSPNLDKQA